MDGPSRLLTLLLLFGLTTPLACKKPAPEKVDVTDSGPAPKPIPKISGVDFTELVTRAQNLRDREFPEPPGLSAVDEPRKRAVPDLVRADREAILFGLFGRTEWESATTPEREIAWWDSGDSLVKIRSDVDATDREKELAVLVALLRGLDAIHGEEPSTPESWDAELAARAVRLGPAYLAASGALAEERREGVTLDLVADYPGVVTDLELADTMFPGDASLERRANAFGPREGYALAAALYRASGWSGVEMAWHDTPTSTAWIVRPDRWLAGEGIGDWEWPKIPTQIREKGGWKVERQGRVGPAITALFLGTAVEPARARIVYVTWQSDAYRSWRRDDSWLFEWVTMWETPTAAEQFVKVAEQALARQGRPGRFSVMRQGPIVALLGSDDPNANLDRHATSVVSMRPTFTPRPRGMIAFEPTPADAAAGALQAATLEEKRWNDPATGLAVDLSPFDGWDVRRADELALRWFARKDGAIVQFSTELPDPLAPDLTDPKWEEFVTRGFAETVEEMKVIEAKETEVYGRPGWEFVLEGKIEGEPKRILVRQFRSEPDAPSQTPRVVIVSAQAPVETFDEVAKKVREMTITVSDPSP